MINQILQTDIDRAKKLIEARHTDDEVVLALTRRGIDHAKAQKMVAELRAGRSVAPELEINYELGKGVPENYDPEPAYVPEAPARRRRSSGSSRGGGGAMKWILLVLIILLAGGALAFFLTQSDKSPERPREKSAMPVEEPAPAPDATNTAATNTTPFPQ